ncbi:MAG TPA: bifunctional nuclease family protein [bacterium]|nr:bifunctional nuclease family protein [bacterium]
MTSEGFTEMKVHRLVLDPNTNSPIVILQSEASGVMLPIWIGIFEAHAIAMKMEGIQSPRPMTHDLLSNTIAVMHGLVERVEVVDLVDNTYFARVYFQVKDERYSIDSRPSDAIALALRAPSPIFVANHVLEKSKIEPTPELEEARAGGDEGEEEDEWTRILKNFNPPGGREKIN